MEPHEGAVLQTMGVRLVYVGDEWASLPSFDGFVTWVLASPEYWGILKQYGVGYGTFDGSDRVPTAAWFAPDSLPTGFISDSDLADIMFAYLRSTSGVSPVRIGPADGGPGSPPPIEVLPLKDETVFFLPAGIGVEFSGGERSCEVFDGYHSFDLRFGPFAVIPSCGRSQRAISHELAEMATDPIPPRGWFAYSEVSIGEVGDLCLSTVSAPIDFWSPTRLWSNADNACMPP
jgi:hypothetical protein